MKFLCRVTARLLAVGPWTRPIVQRRRQSRRYEKPVVTRRDQSRHSEFGGSTNQAGEHDFSRLHPQSEVSVRAWNEGVLGLRRIRARQRGCAWINYLAAA